jgi:hypothetical protein
MKQNPTTEALVRDISARDGVVDALSIDAEPRRDFIGRENFFRNVGPHKSPFRQTRNERHLERVDRHDLRAGWKRVAQFRDSEIE